jgi:hypothetical protein
MDSQPQSSNFTRSLGIFLIIILGGSAIAFVTFTWHSDQLSFDKAGLFEDIESFFSRITPSGRRSYHRGVQLSEIICDYGIPNARLNTEKYSQCVHVGSKDPSGIFKQAFKEEIGAWKDLTPHQQEEIIEDAQSKIERQKEIREFERLLGL